MLQYYSRRKVLEIGCTLAAVTAAMGRITPASAQTPDQRHWRFCTKCAALFFNGFAIGPGGDPARRGKCARDGGLHAPAGFNFEPAFHPDLDLPDTPTTQSRWRFCNKCFVMHFEGARTQDKKCAAGDPHVAQGFHFMLPVNRVGGPVLVPATTTAQSFWRFCGKCTTLFFNGFNDKGACPRGGVHDAIGDTFVLPHDNSPLIELRDEVTQVRIHGDGFVPNQIVFLVINMRRDGSFSQQTAETTTDSDGFFRDSIFGNVQGATRIEVAATDRFTSLVARGRLRFF